MISADFLGLSLRSKIFPQLFSMRFRLTGRENHELLCPPVLNGRLVLEQHGIAKFVSAVAVLNEGRVDLIQHRIIGEGPKELKVVFAGMVDAGEDRIDDTQRGSAYYAPTRNTVSDAYAAVGVCGGFERGPRSSRSR